jgi:hypothetical protein
MKIVPALALLLLASAWTAGQDAPPTHEDVLKKMVGTLEELNKSLASITNQESAAKARPELRKHAEEWVAHRALADKLPPPTRAEKDKLEKEFKGKLEAAQKRLFGEVMRVQNVPGGSDALKEIRGVISRPVK